MSARYSPPIEAYKLQPGPYLPKWSLLPLERAFFATWQQQFANLSVFGRMGSEFSPSEVAARLRGILAGLDRGMVEATARRLGISEVALRMSIDELEPHPTMEVLIAVVRHHGIDPTWLLTGEYDQATHRAAIDDEAALSSKQLMALMAKQMTSPAGAGGAAQRALRLES